MHMRRSLSWLILILALTSAIAQAQLAVTPPATSKGTQGARGIPVQNLRDSGRTFVVCRVLRATAVTTEALASMTCNKGGTDQAAATSYTVTAAKTFRLTSMFLNGINVTTATAAINVAARIRAAATVAASSPVVGALETGIPIAATAVLNTSTYPARQDYPDGIEIAAAQQIGVSHIASSVNIQVTIIFTGFEY